VKIRGKGEKQTESREEMKWRRNNTESRGWIKVRKSCTTQEGRRWWGK
jgi:hypothetical protein